MERHRKTRPATMTCSSCGHSVMLKGGDHYGWKMVQPYPDLAIMWHYCPKKACREALEAAIKVAAKNWGIETHYTLIEGDEGDDTVGPSEQGGGRFDSSQGGYER